MTSSSVKEDLFRSCRQGDIEKVRYLVEFKDVDLNSRDKWDSTPLYNACLCGHYDLVEYMLSMGARCDASTFDGERCIYGALTDQIRKILIDFSVLSTTVKKRDPYPEFLRRLFEDSSFTDVEFQVHGQATRAHATILCARSDYFREQFSHRWRNKGIISIKHSLVGPSAFNLILEWLYCGEVKISIDLVEDLQRLCKQCRLTQLSQTLEDALMKTISFVNSKRGMRIRHVQVNTLSCLEKLSGDFEILAECGFPSCIRRTRSFTNADDRNNWASYDVTFQVNNHLFKAHKAIFAIRSDYFRALISDHFHEALWSEIHDVPVIPIHGVTENAFTEITRHIYANSQNLTPDIVYEVLIASDMFLLPSLRRECGNFLLSTCNVSNVVSLVRTSRLFNLARLEQQCTEFMAKYIEQMIARDDFKELVIEDAQSITDRHETDTIDIIDEIRFFLKNDVAKLSDLDDIQIKMKTVNIFLNELGFDA